MESLWRLVWALPLVIGVGVVAIVLLRRFVPAVSAIPVADRLILEQSLPLSEHAMAHLVRADGESLLVVVAASGVTAVSLPAASTAPPALRSWAGFRPPARRRGLS